MSKVMNLSDQSSDQNSQKELSENSEKFFYKYMDEPNTTVQ